MKDFAYHKPTTVSEAVALLAANSDGRAFSGGMSLLPTMKLRLGAPTALIDLSALPDMAGITIEANASDEGHLYGSVGAPEISRALKGKNLKVETEMVRLEGVIKECGLYEVDLTLGYDVASQVKVMVVPSKQTEKK